MDAPGPSDGFLFDAFWFDRRAGALFRRDEGGALDPVAIGSRALAVLSILMARQGGQVSALRRVLDQRRAGTSCIQTIPGRGYRFVAPVTRSNSAAPPVALLPSGNGVDEHITADEQLQTPLGVPARPDEPSSQASRWRPWRGVIAGVIGALLLIAFGLAGWHLRSSGSDEIRAAPRLSIVVLPFANLSNDPHQQYFADALTEDLTVEMSQIANMFVISSNTAFTYRNNPADTKQIG